MATHRKPHRCNGRLKNGERCRVRKSFRPHQRAPRCPCCSSRLHWYVDEHRAAGRDRKVCKDSRCMYPHPHSVHSALCIHNPNFDEEAFIDAAECYQRGAYA